MIETQANQKAGVEAYQDSASSRERLTLQLCEREKVIAGIGLCVVHSPVALRAFEDLERECEHSPTLGCNRFVRGLRLQ
jgi:hypothetical protein